MIAINLVIVALLLLGASTFYGLGCRALRVAQKQIDARVEQIPERETVRKKAT
jgi:fumarate reductase subunit C